MSVRWIALCCTGIATMTGPLAMADDFEGIIHSAYILRGEKLESKALIKGKKVRMDLNFPAGDSTVYLYDIERQTMVKTVPSKKTSDWAVHSGSWSRCCWEEK